MFTWQRWLSIAICYVLGMLWGAVTIIITVTGRTDFEELSIAVSGTFCALCFVIVPLFGSKK